MLIIDSPAIYSTELPVIKTKLIRCYIKGDLRLIDSLN